jgi:hypothetical protein
MASVRVRMQETEVLGQDNRWYCSQAYCRCVAEPDLLWTYFIKSGGAADFAKRWNEAMGPVNQWFCSEFYRRHVTDAQLLWDYYNKWHLYRGTGLSDQFALAC